MSYAQSLDARWWRRFFTSGLASLALAAAFLTAPPTAARAEGPKTPPAPAEAKPAAADKALPVTLKAEPREAEWWTKRHETINERARKGDFELVFLGDSITQGWEGAGKAVWEKHYADRVAMNAGIGGDGTQHVLWRIANGNLDYIHPKAIVIMIGTNNVAGASEADIAEGVTTIVKRIRDKQPQAKILLLAIFPRGEKPGGDRDKIARINETISRLHDGSSVHYLDIGKQFVNDDGTISREIMPDFLHLSEAGYQRWATAIEPKLAELLGEPTKK